MKSVTIIWVMMMVIYSMGLSPASLTGAEGATASCAIDSAPPADPRVGIKDACKLTGYTTIARIAYLALREPR